MKAHCSKHKLQQRLSLLVFVLAIILAGCSSKTPGGTELVLDPKPGVTKELSGDLYTDHPGHAISPEGEYLLAEQSDDDGLHIVAVSLEDDTGDVVLNTVRNQDSGGYTGQVPIGWTSPTTCVFLVSGKQVQGPNKGKHGVAIMLGDVAVPKTEELGFIELESGSFHSVTFVESDSKVYVHVSKALWEYDIKRESLKLVKGDLPTYDGLFSIGISPSGKYAVYELHEEDREGIYILDIATGEERPLLPTGATKSFLPQWSPDGNYILAYTASQKPNAAELTLWERYEVFQGEDSLLPMASSLTVLTPGGEIQKAIQVPGKTLAHARWARNSKTVGFLAGIPRTAEGGQGFPPDARPGALSYDSAMVVDVSSEVEAVRVADLEALPGFDDPSIDMVFVDPSGMGLYYVASMFVDSSLQGSKLWYAFKGGEPVEVCDGLWQFAGTEPVYGDHVVGVLSLEDEWVVRLVGPEDSRLLAHIDNPRSWITILGYNENLLVVGNLDCSDDADATTVMVYRMYRETPSA
ncbi:MAG TPA: hypothetical protein GX716_08205 [Firmicutes bacterium]|nr:hypothetical protein [Candidatus Fermentithermobacillaceae bacterium]